MSGAWYPPQPYILQQGSVTPGHFAQWSTNGVLIDGGASINSITFQNSGTTLGTATTINSSGALFTLSNGVATLGSPTNPYDIGFFVPGTYTASQVIAAFVMVRAVAFAANFAPSLAKSQTAATLSSTITIQKNGSSIGTIVFAAGASTSTIAGSAVSFAVGDMLSFVAPGTPDATLAGVQITLSGTR